MNNIRTLKFLALGCIAAFAMAGILIESAVFRDSFFWQGFFALLILAGIPAYLTIVHRLAKKLQQRQPVLWSLGSLLMPYICLTILLLKKPATLEPVPLAGFSEGAGGPLAQGSAFCEKCLSETTEESPPMLRMFNGIGTGWGFKSRDKCPKCRSVIKTKCFFIGLPLFPQEKYRVIFLSEKTKLNLQTQTFFARKLIRQD